MISDMEDNKKREVQKRELTAHEEGGGCEDRYHYMPNTMDTRDSFLMFIEFYVSIRIFLSRISSRYHDSNFEPSMSI